MNKEPDGREMKMDSDNVIDRIIALEWEMFQRVNENGPRAECQDDPFSFEAMRRGQFSAWSASAAESYLLDLESAKSEGRNLVAEKYIHMMKNTDLSIYEKLAARTSPPDSDSLRLVDEAARRMLAQAEALSKRFPCVFAAGRPLRNIDYSHGITPIETYQKGELMTYSKRTLLALMAHIEELEAKKVLLVQLIMENYAKHYGYKTLAAAEAASRSKLAKASPRYEEADSGNV
jgi:hypothetical protein